MVASVGRRWWMVWMLALGGGLLCGFSPRHAWANQPNKPPAKQYDVAIAFYQALGAETQLESLFGKIQQAIERDIGLKVMPLAETQAALGKDLGLQALGNDCRGELICMLDTSRKKLPVSQVVFLSVGVLGSAFLVSLRSASIKQEQPPRTLEGKRYNGIAAFEKELPRLLLTIFPGRTRFVIEGSPEGAVVKINDSQVGTLPKVALSWASGEITVSVSHPGYIDNTKRLALLPNRIMTLRVALEKKPVERRIVHRPPPPPPTTTPLHQQWWVWVIGVGVVAGVTVGVVVGVTQSQVYRVQTGL